jgi:hypothetical protein
MTRYRVVQLRGESCYRVQQRGLFRWVTLRASIYQSPFVRDYWFTPEAATEAARGWAAQEAIPFRIIGEVKP